MKYWYGNWSMPGGGGSGCDWCLWPIKGDAVCGASPAQVMFILIKDDIV